MKILIIIFAILLSSCSIFKNKRVKVYPLKKEKKDLFIPVIINNNSYKFKLDLLSQISSVNSKLIKKEHLKKLKSEIYSLENVTIGNITFKNSNIISTDSNIAGVIGADILIKSSSIYINLVDGHFIFNNHMDLSNSITYKNLLEIDISNFKIFSIDFKNRVIRY